MMNAAAAGAGNAGTASLVGPVRRALIWVNAARRIRHNLTSCRRVVRAWVGPRAESLPAFIHHPTMSSFSCPYFDIATGHCCRLKTDCVPGRRGCVLADKVSFIVPAEERVRALEEEKRRTALGRPVPRPGKLRTQPNG